MQYSHSRVEVFASCPYKYKMRYVDRILTLPSCEADNALIIGQALHKGLETDVKTAMQEYYMSYPIITDEHVNEAIKLEYLIPKVKALLPEGQSEVKIETEDFIGFIDLLSPSKVFKRGVELPNSFDIYDFKYSNNISHYMESRQLHLYKYFYEKQHPRQFIKNLFFVFVPKVNIKQKKNEDILQFRRRILNELETKEITIRSVDYQPQKVSEWLLQVKDIQEANSFPKKPNFLCRYCEYQDFCMKGNDYMLLPKNERRNIEKVEKRVIWIYGAPFSGKTVFANKFPEPLMLNTDGNIKFVDSPYLKVADQVTVEGRLTKRKYGWEVFKEIVAELEKKENTFKTIIVDLLEDTYEYARIFMCHEMGISHESDDSFKAWDKVRTEFLNTLKRLVNLDYENIILISHEDTSRDITKKGNDKITAIKPNLQDKVALKVAGMVDLVARVVADGEVRTFNFKSNEVIFGGGRLEVDAKDIPLDVDELFRIYDEANRIAVDKVKQSTSNSTVSNSNSETDSASKETKTRRTRRTATEPSEETEQQSSEKQASEEPTSSRRRRKTNIKDGADSAISKSIQKSDVEGTSVRKKADMGMSDVETDESAAEEEAPPVKRKRKVRK